MSIKQKITANAKNYLNRLSLAKILQDTPIEGPFIGNPVKSNYFENGYEIPILFRYCQTEIKASSIFTDSKAQNYHYPEPDFILKCLYHQIEYQLQAKKEQEYETIANECLKYRHSIFLAMYPSSDVRQTDAYPEQTNSYATFLNNLRSGSLSNTTIESVILTSAKYLPNLQSDAIINIESKINGYFGLHIFPEIIAYTELETLSEKSNKALDSLLIINKNVEIGVSCLAKTSASADYSQFPVHVEPLIVRETLPSGEKSYSLLNLTIQSNKNIIHALESAKKSITQELQILKEI